MAKMTAMLALESGRVFTGTAFGAPGEVSGEVVFNTALTGYQEVFTDPSYKGQIVVMTYPHIGNYGTSKSDNESRKTFLEGLVVREANELASNWRSEAGLFDFMQKHKFPGIEGLDTRALTRHLRETGSLKGVLSTVSSDAKKLVAKAKASSGLSGRDLVSQVTCEKPYAWNEPTWGNEKMAATQRTVVVLDCGIKNNTLRCLADRGVKVVVVPAKSTAKEILEHRPNGLLLSNGPGDPEAVPYAAETVRELLSGGKPLPIFGICLGHQILGLALGGKTFKLKFGHHGTNHPVRNLETGKIEITSQNHGFCVDAAAMADKDVEITHVNLNDNTVEGMRHRRLPVFSVQYHPEAGPGPHDSRYLFDRFVELMDKNK